MRAAPLPTQRLRSEQAKVRPLCPRSSDIHLAGNGQGIVCVGAEVADRIFDRSVAQQRFAGVAFCNINVASVRPPSPDSARQIEGTLGCSLASHRSL